MNTYCSTCNVPWDIHHLRHDAIYETGLSEAEVESWLELPVSKSSARATRKSFAQLDGSLGRV